MPVTSGMFLFEVVVEAVNSLVTSKTLVIRSDFADIFSLELRDPKQMYIVMPEPLPPPPEPPGKKKKKPPKPKKGKKGKEELPPPEPVIQSGQSVLFGSTAEFLIENMLNFPLEVSLWSKEDNLTYIGAVAIPWDPKFLTFLKLICNCQDPPPTTVRDEYNIFQEGVATLMAKIGLQVKLSFLKNKITCAFRTLTEDLTAKKFLYTGMNSRTTSYMCTMKTTDEDFEQNCNKIENQYIIDKPKPKIAYASFKNAPGAELPFFEEGDYCCMNKSDKPPTSKYDAPETCPDIDTIIEYVRKIIVSCNDQMRMLTPRPTLTPRIKATDIDRRCYCKETAWPPGDFAERFRREAQSGPCPICADAGKRPEGNRPATFDIANIRGPCGRPECKVARYLRAYIEKLVDEDNEQFNINDIVGPCGSEDCTLAEKIKEFLRHEGVFTHANVKPGLSTQCGCIEKMQEELCRQDESCASTCEHECELVGSQEDHCMEPSCPYDNPDIKRVYNVYYFTVEHDFDKDASSPKSPSTPTTTTTKTATFTNTGSAAPSSRESSSEDSKCGADKFKYCGTSCPSVKFAANATCSKAACACNLKKDESFDSKCTSPVCNTSQVFPPSPADSDVVMKMKEIVNPCCVKSCDIVEKVRDFIDLNAVRDVSRKKVRELEDNDPCYCDCVCNFHFTSKTTYCPICGGYECLGDDMKDIPPFAIPHPCPIYHKLYDKKNIKVDSPWPDEPPPAEEPKKEPPTKKLGSKPGLQKSEVAKSTASKSTKSTLYDKDEMQAANKPTKQAKQEQTKSPAQRVERPAAETPEDRLMELKNKYLYPPVPPDMGWNWKAEDIPALKYRPDWKPGAAHKNLVRKYRAAKEGTDIIAKKKRLMMKGKKKLELKPTLIVTKRDGEYTVQMEVFKKYSKERLLYQYPYDEKPPQVYTIGKSPAERRKKQAQRDRRARREVRRKCRLLQSTFRDKCQEICVKAYNQAIGVLPLPNPNNPECPCETTGDPGPSPIIDSCSCSEEGSISSSDTDNDEWVIEFTPPLARWDVKAKHAPITVDNEAQYNYLDYKVKVLDKNGNQVPRFFKSHEGKTECSDLGGFWGPGKKVWLEINKDGFIGQDGRWIPMNFTGPDGLQYSAEEGSFTDTCGQVLTPGVDGYIDKDLKWVWYSKRKQAKAEGKGTKPKAEAKASAHRKDPMESTGPGGRAGGDRGAGDKAGGKEKDKKVAIAAGTKTGPNRNRNQTVMNLSYNPDFRMSQRPYISRWDKKSTQDFKKIAKYREIMKQLEMYEDLGEAIKPVKYNRASNYPSKKPSRIRQDTFKMTASLLRVDGDSVTATPKSSLRSPHRY